MAPDNFLYAANFFSQGEENRLIRIDPVGEILLDSYLLPGRLPFQGQTYGEAGIFTLPDLIDCPQPIDECDNDTIPPIISCPVISIIPITPNLETCTAILNVRAEGTDNCIFGISCVRSDGLDCDDPYPSGVTTATFTATDEGGNTDVCNVRVIVEDCMLPVDSTNCCPNLENRITNGDFESGNIGFESEYIFQPDMSKDAILPGNYGVINSADASTICEHWSIDDHTTDCDGAGNFLVVNGQVGQATNSIIWEQTVTGLDTAKMYELCAFFKNLQQCCFDIRPTIDVLVDGDSVASIILDNTSTNPCDWQNVNIPLDVNSNSVTISFELDESLLGDGNDFAIDDISLYELEEFDLMLSTQDQRPKDANIMASINLIDVVDDSLPSLECQYKWTVGLVEDIDIQGQEFSLDSMTVACGDSEQTTAYPWNTLTTDFIGYDGTNTFNSTATPGQFGEGLYMVQLEVSNCPCLQDAIERKFVGWFPSWNRQTNPMDLTRFNMSKQSKELLKRLDLKSD